MRIKNLMLFLAIISSLYLNGCSKKEEKKDETQKQKIKAELLIISKKNVSDIYEVSGTVTSKNPVNIVSKTTGTVVQVNAVEGEKVNKGKLLILIDSPEIRAMLQSAESSIQETKKALDIAKANLNLAESTYRRYENLFKEQAISRQEFENIETKYIVAKNEVGRLENAVRQAEAEKSRIKGMESHLYINAPVSGIVTQKFVNPGYNVMTGTQLITVEPEDSLRIEVNADEKILSLIKKGMKIPVYIDALKKEFLGIVSEYVPAVDPNTRTFKIKIDLPKDPKLAIGLYGTVKISLGKKESLWVPQSAIYLRGQLSYVFVVDKDKVLNLRLVRTGKVVDGEVEILSGLNEGDQIVKTITENVKEGVIVE